MKHRWRQIRILLAVVACAGLVGCSSLLKPSGINPRYFVLTPMPANPPPAAASGVAIGLGVVKLPDYLLDKAMVCRMGTNEITRVEDARWAERLDHGLQRVLAANLATRLPGDRVRLSAWQPEEVGAEILVTVSQFDVDDTGRAVLAASWRIQAPGTGNTLQAEQFHGERNSVSPAKEPQKAVAALSDLAGELSESIAQAIKGSAR